MTNISPLASQKLKLMPILLFLHLKFVPIYAGPTNLKKSGGSAGDAKRLHLFKYKMSDLFQKIGREKLISLPWVVARAMLPFGARSTLSSGAKSMLLFRQDLCLSSGQDLCFCSGQDLCFCPWLVKHLFHVQSSTRFMASPAPIHG